MRAPSNMTTFFNILDTHDGIGLMGVKEILPKEEIDFIIERAKGLGAYISYKMTEARTEEPYEINTTWWGAINGDHNEEDIGFQVKRYLASRSLALVLQGIPGHYAHGAIGSANDHELVEKTHVKRDVNRAVIHVENLMEEAKNPDSKISHLAVQSPKLNLTRTRERAFHPQGGQKVLMISPHVFTVLRTSPEGDTHILTMTNVANKTCGLEMLLADICLEETRWYDLLSKAEYVASSGKLSLVLQPYDVVWLKPRQEI